MATAYESPSSSAIGSAGGSQQGASMGSSGGGNGGYISRKISPDSGVFSTIRNSFSFIHVYSCHSRKHADSQGISISSKGAAASVASIQIYQQQLPLLLPTTTPAASSLRAQT
ncbi:hypothetical protein BASA62_003777 [Batrachochytrium salamandrivorans]|nr:hypothetical protein BASA62_003777 [Batrachochytrium salamandrivorans]